jgi:hypothetical protein
MAIAGNGASQPGVDWSCVWRGLRSVMTRTDERRKEGSPPLPVACWAVVAASRNK